MGKEFIHLSHISKSFDNDLILDDLDLVIKENEFMTLLGPSGCGKTTTLRILGGFETPDKGQVFFDGTDITMLPPNERKLNTVFQKYALFTHMTIAENIAFGLKISKKSKAYIDDKIKYALKLVNLDGFENRTVDSLSGGQQQRIAIARAIVNEPKLLLLDEPLGALDLKLRQDMQYELIRLKEELGITFARAMAIRCCWPPLKESTVRFSNPSRFTSFKAVSYTHLLPQVFSFEICERCINSFPMVKAS